MIPELKSERSGCRARLIDKSVSDLRIKDFCLSGRGWGTKFWNTIFTRSQCCVLYSQCGLVLQRRPCKEKSKGSQRKQGNNSFLWILIVNYGKAFCLFLLHPLVVWRAAMATTLNQYTCQRLMQNMPQFAYDHNLEGLMSKAQKNTNWINHQPRNTVQPATSTQGIYLRSCCS